MTLPTQLWVDHHDREWRVSTAEWPDLGDHGPLLSAYQPGMAALRTERRRRCITDRRVAAVANRRDGESNGLGLGIAHHPKPRFGTGLWTSSYGAEGNWLDYMDKSAWYPQNPGGPEAWIFWLLEVDPAARVYEIDGLADLLELCRRYPTTKQRSEYPFDTAPRDITVDWAAAARDLDAVHLTYTGHLQTQMPRDDALPDLAGWDCECTLWFRWRFGTIRQVSASTAYEPHGREPFCNLPFLRAGAATIHVDGRPLRV